LTESDAVDAITEGGVAGNDRIDWILSLAKVGWVVREWLKTAKPAAENN